jgi:Protein of unknown function (DUF2971)
MRDTMTTESGEPELVYHYTTMEAMMKIVRSRTVWATSISYLNDFSEGEHFMKLILGRLPSYLKRYGLGDEIAILMKSELMGTRQSFKFRPYVASFSAESDSLPQWRSYCASGNGISIGFKVERLKRAMLVDDENKARPEALVSFSPVEYVDDKGDESLDAEIADAVRGSEELAQQVQEADGRKNFASLYFRLLIEHRASFKKHISFSNECEHRIIVDPLNLSPDFEFVQYRATRSTLVPYVIVSVPPSRVGSNGSDFIQRVVIGPTSNMGLSFQAVEAFFKQCGIDVKVDPSKIPYRDW